MAYYNFGIARTSQHSYPVGWGIPELLEHKIEDSMDNDISSIKAPGWLIGKDIAELSKSSKSDDASKFRELSQNICLESESDVIMFLGTTEIPLEEGAFGYKTARGYGIYTASGYLARPFFAYTSLTAALVNCSPLDPIVPVTAISKVPIDKFKASSSVEALTESDLQFAFSSIEESFAHSSEALARVVQSMMGQKDESSSPKKPGASIRFN